MTNWSPLTSFPIDSFEQQISAMDEVHKKQADRKKQPKITCSMDTKKLKQLSMEGFCISPSKGNPPNDCISKTPCSEPIKGESKKESKKKRNGKSHKVRDKDKGSPKSRDIKRKDNTGGNMKLYDWLAKKKPDILENNRSAGTDSTIIKTDLTSRKKQEFKRNSSGSFEKYGIALPSFDDIIANKRQFEQQKQCLEEFANMDESQESLELLQFDFDESSSASEKSLDCKHLTASDLDDAFENNSQYVCDIFNGRRYSARHQRFKEQNCKDQFTFKDLRYNTSMLTFTYEQKLHLLSNLHKKFDTNEMFGKNDKYFFKVLLPELCTKIFMDEYNMTCQEAHSYLEKRAV